MSMSTTTAHRITATHAPPPAPPKHPFEMSLYKWTPTDDRTGEKIENSLRVMHWTLVDSITWLVRTVEYFIRNSHGRNAVAETVAPLLRQAVIHIEESNNYMRLYLHNIKLFACLFPQTAGLEDLLNTLTQLSSLFTALKALENTEYAMLLTGDENMRDLYLGITSSIAEINAPATIKRQIDTMLADFRLVRARKKALFVQAMYALGYMFKDTQGDHTALLRERVLHHSTMPYMRQLRAADTQL